MKTRLLPVAALLATLLPAQRQERSQDEYKQMRAEKLAKEVFKKASWIRDYDKARETAKQEGKLIFAYFTRSYVPCERCAALESGPLSDPEFEKFAKSAVLFLHNTSRVEGDEAYPNLHQEKGFKPFDFPTVCFMDAAGNVLTKPGNSVKSFLEGHAESTAIVTLRNKGDKATAAERKQLFLSELKSDLIPAAEIQVRSDRITDLSTCEKELVASKLVDAEVRALFGKGRELGPEKMRATFAELAKAGKVPSETLSGPFWRFVLEHASKQKDASLAQKAYDALMKRYAKETGDKIDSAKQAWQKLLEDAKAK
jgi:hypothetical protein